MLSRGPAHYGYGTARWTLWRVGEVIEKYFGVYYCDEQGVGYTLKRMGWSYQRPEYRARKRGEDATAASRLCAWAPTRKGTKKRA
ncbi:MAG: winged helix-turn-helix domain-containing protein [Planctomycetes bacterium]|nr:winged helix-turn-helix domain-containing protein [Planctomycetota bacterium]